MTPQRENSVTVRKLLSPHNFQQKCGLSTVAAASVQHDESQIPEKLLTPEMVKVVTENRKKLSPQPPKSPPKKKKKEEWAPKRTKFGESYSAFVSGQQEEESYDEAWERYLCRVRGHPIPPTLQPNTTTNKPKTEVHKHKKPKKQQCQLKHGVCAVRSPSHRIEEKHIATTSLKRNYS